MVDSVALGWQSFVRGMLLPGSCWRNSTQENWILDTHLHGGFRFNGGRRKHADLVRGGLVVAGFAAGDAIHEAVPANPYVHLRLAEAATLLAPTLVFWLLTLGAAVLGGAGSGGHEANVAR